MQSIKRIKPLFLSFILIAWCINFQADTLVTKESVVNTSWVINNLNQSVSENAYRTNLKRAHSIFENNFSIFNFKCCLKHHDSLCEMQYKKQDSLYLPNQSVLLKVIQQNTNLKADSYLG